MGWSVGDRVGYRAKSDTFYNCTIEAFGRGGKTVLLTTYWEDDRGERHPLEFWVNRKSLERPLDHHKAHEEWLYQAGLRDYPPEDL